MSLLITGSVAYDHIMVFPGHFKDHILTDKTHLLSVCFNVDSLDIRFGGTAANIAYTLSLLGKKCDIFATVGKDFERYDSRLRGLGFSTGFIRSFSDVNTAQAFIMTDLDDNQISAFYGAAMYRSHEHPLSEYGSEPSYVIISPNGLQAMVDHTEYCRNMGWSFLFDPGQSLSALSSEQTLSCLRGAYALLVNDYEFEMLLRKTKLKKEDILDMVSFVVVTRGSRGARLFTKDEVFETSAVPDIRVIDPTGAGDAFRAGLLSSLLSGFSFLDMLRFSCAVASFALSSAGTQSHSFTRDDVNRRMSLI